MNPWWQAFLTWLRGNQPPPSPSRKRIHLTDAQEQKLRTWARSLSDEQSAALQELMHDEQRLRASVTQRLQELGRTVVVSTETLRESGEVPTEEP